MELFAHVIVGLVLVCLIFVVGFILTFFKKTPPSESNPNSDPNSKIDPSLISPPVSKSETSCPLKDSNIVFSTNSPKPKSISLEHVKTTSPTKRVRLVNNTPISESEEQFYEIAYSELQNDAKKQGLWAKAFSETMGDEKKSEALYIKYRVEQLRLEQQKLAQKQKIEDPENTGYTILPTGMVLFKCSGCNTTLSLTKKQFFDPVSPFDIRCACCDRILNVKAIRDK